MDEGETLERRTVQGGEKEEMPYTQEPLLAQWQSPKGQQGSSGKNHLLRSPATNMCSSKNMSKIHQGRLCFGI